MVMAVLGKGWGESGMLVIRSCDMDYSEAVKGKIPGQGNELERRKKLWGEIDNAYESGGDDAIKPVLIEYSDHITSEFHKLLKKIREKL